MRTARTGLRAAAVLLLWSPLYGHAAPLAASDRAAFGAEPVAATLLRMLTGIGGGMVRDVLVREIPTVLHTELYAVASLIGAATVVIGKMLRLPSSGAAASSPEMTVVRSDGQ